MTTFSKAMAACSTAAFVIVGPNVSAHDRITTKVTWDREIAPIVRARCVGCHQTDGPTASIALSTYKEARPWAAAIKEEVMTRRMPKWPAARGYGDFANDPSLSPFEIALIAAWADGGAPEAPKGTAAAAAAATPRMPAPYQPPRGVTRSIACGDSPIAGRLLGVRPRLSKDGVAGISALLPSGRTEIVAWIRRFDPAYPDTLWLRRPLDLPRGSRLRVDAHGDCAVDIVMAR